MKNKEAVIAANTIRDLEDFNYKNNVIIKEQININEYYILVVGLKIDPNPKIVIEELSYKGYSVDSFIKQQIDKLIDKGDLFLRKDNYIDYEVIDEDYLKTVKYLIKRKKETALKNEILNLNDAEQNRFAIEDLYNSGGSRVYELNNSKVTGFLVLKDGRTVLANDGKNGLKKAALIGASKELKSGLYVATHMNFTGRTYMITEKDIDYNNTIISQQ